MDLETLNARLDDVRELYSAAKDAAESFPEEDTLAYYYEGMAAQLAEAEQAAESAGTFYNGAVAAKDAAVAAKDTAVSAQTAAEAAETAAENASGIAVDAKDAALAAQTAAEQASTEAVTKVEGAAQVGESNEFTANNTFTGVNTFNGALVANTSLTYKSQELNNLLSYPIAAQLMAAGINPASAISTTWDDWVSKNPNWLSLEDLLFYAPLITGAVGSDLPENVNSPFKSCTFISPAQARTIPSAYMFGKKVKYFTWRGGINHEVFDCYYVVDCDFYAPNAEALGTALNAIGYLTNGTSLSLNVYIPLVKRINTEHGSGSTFYRIGLLKSFSIYAPELKTSFSFSRSTQSKIGQTCAILQALIAGIGTPETEQTITTLTPSDGDVVQTVDGVETTNLEILKEAAAAKNWKFILPDGTDL